MSWSKVNIKNRKPIKWWIHKLACEWGWFVRSKDNYATYYHHLDMLCKQGYNLYGDKIKEKDLKE